VNRLRWVEPVALLAGLGMGLGAFLEPSTPEIGIPARLPRPAYLGSEGCQMCHPSEYQSWHATYHRTMTRRPHQVAWDGERGPTLPVTLTDGHFSFELEREGTQIVARGQDLHAAAQYLYVAGQEARARGADRPSQQAVERALEHVPTASRPVALVTGSHHYLALWLAHGSDRELRQLPFVYHLEERKWSPRSQAFLEPPDSPPYIATWNSNCIQCHAVAGEPRETEWRDDTGALHVRYDSRVAELGIACEACHGPGRGHADFYRDPARRLSASLQLDEAAQTPGSLMNPAEAGSVRGSAVCGQCHAYFVPVDEAEFWTSGYAPVHLPGQSLTASRKLLSPDEPSGGATLSRELSSIFWPDGTMRVGGREYAGLIASACYLRGSGERQLGCTTCHSMHESEPNDQLNRRAARDENAPCADCHQATPEHSGHVAGSVGAACVNCHMPRTTYALLGSIRSHRIQIPRPEDTRVPSACALCHVDRPLAWFATLPAQSSPGAPHPSSEPKDTAEIGVGVRGAIAGNAAERAIYAAALGSRETQLTVGIPLARRLLERLSHDPYHAVRRIAERGLRALPDGGDGPAVPLDAAVLDRLARDRDDRDVVISE